MRQSFFALRLAFLHSRSSLRSSLHCLTFFFIFSGVNIPKAITLKEPIKKAVNMNKEIDLLILALLQEYKQLG